MKSMKRTAIDITSEYIEYAAVQAEKEGLKAKSVQCTKTRSDAIKRI